MTPISARSSLDVVADMPGKVAADRPAQPAPPRSVDDGAVVRAVDQTMLGPSRSGDGPSRSGSGQAALVEVDEDEDEDEDAAGFAESLLAGVLSAGFEAEESDEDAADSAAGEEPRESVR